MLLISNWLAASTVQQISLRVSASASASHARSRPLSHLKHRTVVRVRLSIWTPKAPALLTPSLGLGGGLRGTGPLTSCRACDMYAWADTGHGQGVYRAFTLGAVEMHGVQVAGAASMMSGRPRPPVAPRSTSFRRRAMSRDSLGLHADRKAKGTCECRQFAGLGLANATLPLLNVQSLDQIICRPAQPINFQEASCKLQPVHLWGDRIVLRPMRTVRGRCLSAWQSESPGRFQVFEHLELVWCLRL